METSIFSSKPIPHFSNPFKQEPQFPHSSKPINPKLSFPNKPHLTHIQLKKAVTSLTHNDKVTSDTYISLLQSCIDLDAIDLGRKLHANISRLHDNINSIIFVETKLISMYAKCGSLKDARQVFDEMRERNLFTFSAMIGGYAREQRWGEIIELFYCMMVEGVVPDEFLLPKVLQACGNVADVNTGEMIHSFGIRYGLVNAIQVGNCLVSMYAKCGKLKYARKYFEKMEERVSVTWNAIISGYCQVGDNEEATRLFRRMLSEGVDPGLITWNIMIASYNQSGNCDLAMQLMKKMSMCGIVPDVFTWTSMISGCDQNKREREALELFREMVLTGVEPNGVTIASAVSACSSLRALRQGKELHSVGVKLGNMSDVLLGNALIEMYSKCGEFEAARSIFDMTGEKDVFTWNSMISGYIQAGHFGKAYNLFKRMQDSPIKPNVVTWNVLISGYIHVRDEDQAMELFQRMEEDGIIKRNASSWNSLISGFLHNGETNKAFKIFRQMQFSTRPSSITMLTILPACANLLASKKVKEIHGYVFRRRFELDISVANILIEAYARSGNIRYARAIFEAHPTTDVISWNTIIAGYVLHGCPSIALDFFKRMILVGPRPNKGTFASIIMAYSHAGMVEEGNMAFTTMINDYLIPPGSEHYAAMLDLLGRSNRLGEATNFIEDLGIEQETSVWNALLTASRVHGNIGLAVRAAEYLLALEPKNAVVHRLLLQLYALSGDSKELLRLRTAKTRARNNSIGCSLMEYGNEVHTIMTGDWYVGKNSDLIYAQLSHIAEEIKTTSHGSHETQLCIDEEEKEEISGTHSEKLAISFALISSPYSYQEVRIMKNFRMCRDCHETAKFISLRYGREIYLYDKKCFHHFKNGLCSCKDYW